MSPISIPCYASRSEFLADVVKIHAPPIIRQDGRVGLRRTVQVHLIQISVSRFRGVSSNLTLVISFCFFGLHIIKVVSYEGCFCLCVLMEEVADARVCFMDRILWRIVGGISNTSTASEY